MRYVGDHVFGMFSGSCFFVFGSVPDPLDSQPQQLHVLSVDEPMLLLQHFKKILLGVLRTSFHQVRVRRVLLR